MRILFLILFPSLLFSQTRLYLTRLTPAIISITPNANWNVTTGNLLWLLNTFFDKTTSAAVVTGQSGAAAPRKMIARQLITLPLIAQTINGTLTMQQGTAITTGFSGTCQETIYIRVINKDGSIASEVGNSSSISFTTTTGTNKTITYSFSNLSILSGQRICIDVGLSYITGSSTTLTGNVNFAAISTYTDLPIDNTTLARTIDTVNPWIEFSQTLKFQKQSNFFF